MALWIWIIVAIVVLAAILVAVWMTRQARRRQRLQQQFGPEYERAVEQAERPRAAEAELESRREHRERLDIRPLSSEARDRYASSWGRIESRFLDAPAVALQEADLLVVDVMREMGYPADDFDRRVADVSVDHPAAASRYRDAHAISARAGTGQADTEQMRLAIVHYRELLTELLRKEPVDQRSR